ncbi:glycine zipper 2TM domain-containing protein [Ramlibacter sp. WS9]|uniref:glycine zipper 2TM domain-containing protein n=1 Tax=Ramlibacter sp. WS9 TaxID=1882741 RepID=UPI001144FA37|nr:glycine zipper 2TM domain-containing protein [Ramlibacter sp. WS9]ROZ75098.1 glycine zipper 2TM domain-containing protein [Ramlibacter sp. WS9]
MKQAVLFSAMGILASASSLASADEFGRVLSTTPVMQQVAVPRQVCSQPMVVQQPSSGGGAVIGAIVGGLLGNTIGHGMGRAAATGVGMVAGAAVGDSIEGRSQPQAMQQCSTQTFYENRTTAYNVVYEYAGKQFNVQLPYDPGQTIRLQLTPVGAGSAPPSTFPSTFPSAVGTPVPSTAQPVIVAPPVGSAVAPMVQSDQADQPGQAVAHVVAMPVAYPAPVAYYAPAYYGAAPYYPIGLSLGFGFSGGHRHHHGHRHWR